MLPHLNFTLETRTPQGRPWEGQGGTSFLGSLWAEVRSKRPVPRLPVTAYSIRKTEGEGEGILTTRALPITTAPPLWVGFLHSKYLSI